MEIVDRDLEERVWRRVRGEMPEEGDLCAAARELAELYGALMGRAPGQVGRELGKFRAQTRQEIARLEELCRVKGCRPRGFAGLRQRVVPRDGLQRCMELELRLQSGPEDPLMEKIRERSRRRREALPGLARRWLG